MRRTVYSILRGRYRRLARQVVGEVEDYQRSGFTVVAIVGVGGSPSCGVDTTLDLSVAAHAVGARRRTPVSAAWMNESVVAPAVVAGPGLYVDALTRELARRGLDVPVREHVLAGS